MMEITRMLESELIEFGTKALDIIEACHLQQQSKQSGGGGVNINGNSNKETRKDSQMATATDTARRYIGTKVITAWPQQKDGKDGYESWSPKDVFEEAYRLCDAMTFGLAIETMKKGGMVRLPKWSPDVFISIQIPIAHSEMTAPYFYVTSRFGRVPWIPTMIEMFSEEWAIAE